MKSCQNIHLISTSHCYDISLIASKLWIFFNEADCWNVQFFITQSLLMAKSKLDNQVSELVCVQNIINVILWKCRSIIELCTKLVDQRERRATIIFWWCHIQEVSAKQVLLVPASQIPPRCDTNYTYLSFASPRTTLLGVVLKLIILN